MRRDQGEEMKFQEEHQDTVSVRERARGITGKEWGSEDSGGEDRVCWKKVGRREAGRTSGE